LRLSSGLGIVLVCFVGDGGAVVTAKTDTAIELETPISASLLLSGDGQMTRKNGAKDNAQRSGEGWVGNPNGGGDGSQRPAFKGFVNTSFQDKDIADFNAWLEDGENYFASFSESVSLGWQYTIKTDVRNQCVVATASNWDGSNQNAGWMLPLRANDPARALAKAVWCLSRFYAYQIHNRGTGLRDGELW